MVSHSALQRLINTISAKGGAKHWIHVHLL